MVLTIHTRFRIALFSSVYKPLGLWFGCLLFAFLPSTLSSIESLLSVESRLKIILEEKSDCVVRVKATKLSKSLEKSKRILKMGSGFFISKEGHVLTTGLLPFADRIWIEHHDTYHLAHEIGRDPLCNLSLLKISQPPSSIKYVRVNDNSSNLDVGSFVVGITFALEFQIGPTLGLLQSYESSFGKSLFPTKLMRSSLALGPGEVGAPVFDLNGRFVGITHAALPDLRSSFILPAKACQRIRDDLLLSGKVDYAWFGISTTRKVNESNSFDVIISGFVADSPAQKSELKIGDHLLKVGNHTITSNGDLANASFFSQPDTIIEFAVIRNKEELTIPVQVSTRAFNRRADYSESSVDSLNPLQKDGASIHTDNDSLTDANASD